MSEVEFTELGRTGIRVSRLCVGTWQASGWSSSDDRVFVKTLRHALDKGLNFIDTAAAYGKGHSEQLVGAALRGHREKFVVATKFWHANSAPSKLRVALEESLKNLGTDYVDLYQQHWPPKKPPLADTIGELVKLKEEGKIRAIGVSNWMEPEWEEYGSADHIDCLQPNYSLLFRTIERNILPFCRDHNIAVIPYSPLCQGILAGKFHSLDQVPEDHRKKNIFLQPDTFPAIVEFLKTLSKVAERYGKSPAATSLRWLLDRAGVTAPIVGASSPEQVEANCEAFGWRLEESDFELLSNNSRKISADLQPYDSLWNFHPRK